MIFEDRVAAGRRLASELGAYAGLKDVIVLGIPRGGVPVAFEVARVRAGALRSTRYGRWDPRRS